MAADIAAWIIYIRASAIPNSKRVYAVSDDRVSLIDLNFNDRAMVPASKISEFGIAVRAWVP